MRDLLYLTPVLLAACAAAPPNSGIPSRGEVAGRTCDASGTDRFIGMAGTSETGSEILAATNSADLRWITPGTMVTMEFNASRVNVHLDSANRIIKIVCG